MGQALLKLFGEVVGVVQVSLGLRHSSVTVGVRPSHNCVSWAWERELMLSECYEQTANMG